MALSNSQYELIMKGYERARDTNRFLLERRREQIYNAIPEFRELAESVSSLAVASGRRMLALGRMAPEKSAIVSDNRKSVYFTPNLIFRI